MTESLQCVLKPLLIVKQRSGLCHVRPHVLNTSPGILHNAQLPFIGIVVSGQHDNIKKKDIFSAGNLELKK